MAVFDIETVKTNLPNFDHFWPFLEIVSFSKKIEIYLSDIFVNHINFPTPLNSSEKHLGKNVSAIFSNLTFNSFMRPKTPKQKIVLTVMNLIFFISYF
jgi:hypothetical protein